MHVPKDHQHRFATAPQILRGIMNPEFWFIATQRFDPTRGDAWKSYLQFSGLTQLEAVVSLDGLLNPKVILDRIDEDGEHSVQQENWTDFFLDLKYLLQRLGPRVATSNVLAVVVDPWQDFAEVSPVPQTPAAFDFVGYDLVDGAGGISALTNCGGFDDVFKPEELTEHGLIVKLARAQEIQTLLRQNYPGEPQAKCLIVAIWRLNQALAN